MATINDVLQSNQKLNEVQNRLFNVVLKNLFTDTETMEVPNHFAVFKAIDDKQIALGVIGHNFCPTQPKAIFDAFCDACLANNVKIDKLQFIEMRGGQKVRFRVPIKKISFTNLLGKKDTTEVYLNVQTGFDGATATSLYLETYRMICKNGMKKTFTEFKAKFKNTNGNNGKIAGMIADVSKALSQVKTLNQMYVKLNDVKVDADAVRKYIERVFDYNLEYFDAAKEYYTKFSEENNEGISQNALLKLKKQWLEDNGIERKDLMAKESVAIVENVYKCIDWEFERAGETAFALFNGITHYTNHVAVNHENPEYIILDQGVRTNDKALKEILTLN
jgi:hypothetical protein